MTDTRDPDCIFCKIIAGDIPCHKVYDNDLVLAFLDINPLSHGHVLIIPNNHAVTVDRLSAEDAAACGEVLPALAKAVMQATGAKAYNVLQNNGKAAHQAVDHVHFHIIPRDGQRGLGIDWNPTELESDAATRLAQTIRAAL